MDARYYDDPDNPPADTPLLGLDELDSDGEEGHHEADGGDAPGGRIALNAAWYQVKTPKQVIIVIAFNLFFLTLSGTIAIVPLFRLLENIFCLRYYEKDGSTITDPIPEEKCKVDEIQANLAWFGGIYAVVNGVTSLVVSLPWGILSDRIGRKPVLWLSVMSLMISGTWSVTVIMYPHRLPIELMFLAPLFLIFGGGIDVNLAVIHTIIADVASDRTAAFVWAGLGAVVGASGGPAISALLIQKYGPWVPLYASGTVITPMMLATYFMIPETLPRKTKDEPGLIALPETVPAPRRADEPLITSLRITARTTAKNVRKGFRESMQILNNHSVRVLLIPFILHAAIGQSGTGIFAQSISVRFGWTIAQAAYLFTLKGILTLFFLIALPFASKVLLPPTPASQASSAPEVVAPPLRRRSRFLPTTPFGRDLILLQFSILMVLIASVLMAIPALASMITGMVVSTTGAGLLSVAKALVGYYVDKDKTARLYTLTGMVETVGTLIAGPSLAWSFGAGVKAGGIWVGLPFFYIAVFCGVVMMALMFVKAPRAKRIVLGDGVDGQA